MIKTQEVEQEIPYDPACAWCLQEQGKPQGNGSHDICKKHAKQIETEYQLIRSNRARRKQG